MVKSRTLKTEEELSKRLIMSLIGIVSIIIISILSLFIFAPKIGSIFGLLSVHRNETTEVAKVKVTRPVFSYLPTATSSENITLNGYATPGTTVKLFLNGPEVGSTVVGSDGGFTINGITLNEGKNTLFAKAVDNQGNESENTNSFYIVLDKKGPKFEELKPGDGDTVRNLDKRILITGKLNKKATITVNDRVAIQKADLSFEFLMGVNEGTVKIKIVAIDEAGNKTEKNITVKYEKKSS